MSNPLKCKRLYRSIEPCPALKTNLSRLIQSGCLFDTFKKFLYKTTPISAIPSGIPGCPEFALSTAAAERTLIDFVTSSNIALSIFIYQTEAKESFA